MRQRGAIARAFVTDPAMLLMDEPFAALDAQNRAILQAELTRIWEETGKTVIYVTHSIEEALLLGDRCVLMTAQPGRIKRIIDIPFAHPRDVITLARVGAVRRDEARHLARARGGSEPGASGRRRMSDKDPRAPALSASRRSALLVVWELLLRNGFGDRRFVPAPSDIAVRFWQLSLNGELLAHTAATVLRASAGFVIGVVPAIAIGLLMAMFAAGAHRVRSADRRAVPDPESGADAAGAARLRLRRCLEDRARRARGVLSGDRQHLCGRGQHRQDLLGRGEELRRQQLCDVHPRGVLRRAAADLCRPAASRWRCRSSCWWRPNSSRRKSASAT